MCPLQALKVLKEMQQRKAFTSLLGVSLAEAGKTNDKAQAAQMRSLDLSMHIATGTLPDAWVVGHQVSEPGLPLYITSPTCTTYSARQTSWCCHPLSYNHDVQEGVIRANDNKICHLLQVFCFSAADRAAQKSEPAQQQPGRSVSGDGEHER